MLLCSSVVYIVSVGGGVVERLTRLSHSNNGAPYPSGSRVNSVQIATRTPHDANLRAVGPRQTIQVQIPVGESNAKLPPLSLAVSLCMLQLRHLAIVV